ncbi:MAG: rhomboid family intramembrane serine protease [Actinobacteria bacterium]|nr:rhomboid family intramembrane serine protease [Actinomycetota bacterium]
MTCPNCGRVLIKEKFANQDVDICPSCGGMWCPTSNIGWYIRLYSQSDRSIKPNNAAQSAESLGAQDHRSIPGYPTQNAILQGVEKRTDATEGAEHACPSCGNSMAKFDYEPDLKIFLDHCPVCGGTWIGAVGLKALTDYLKPPAPRPDNTADQELMQDNVCSLGNTDRAGWKSIRSGETEFFDNMKVSLIRRILGIPYVERHLSIIPWVTVGIIVLNVVLYFFLVDSVPDRGAVIKRLGFVPADISSNPAGALLTFFSSMFMHGSVGHLVWNMIFFWLFGSRIEEDYGPKMFIVFYLISGIVAGLVHTAFNLGSMIPVVGASGAISGVFGAFFVLHPRLRVIAFFMLISIRLSAAVYLGLWFVAQILNSIVTASAGGAGIAWFAHIGGFIAGALMAYPLRSSSKAIVEQIRQAA